MKKLRVTLVKGLGNSFLNAVRSAAFLSYPVARPVAFKVGGASNVLNISDNVLEDMTAFISNVSQKNYSYHGNRSLILAEVECDGELRLSELLKDTGISCKEDAVILHSQAPVKVQVIFGCRAGNHLLDDNARFVENAGYSGYTAINSRGCILESFNVHLVEKSDTTETFEVTIKAVDDTSEAAILEQALALVKSAVEDTYNLIKG